MVNGTPSLTLPSLPFQQRVCEQHTKVPLGMQIMSLRSSNRWHRQIVRARREKDGCTQRYKQRHKPAMFTATITSRTPAQITS